MKSDQAFRRWKRRLRTLLEGAETERRLARASGPAEAVHELRVALRRLRLMVRLGRPLIPDSSARRLGQWSRRVSDALGRVRDYDVTIDWLSRQPDSAPLTALLQTHRARLWRTARARLIPLPAGTASALLAITARRGERQRFQRHYERFHRKRLRRLAQTAPRFFDLPLAEQHAFRRQLRRVRFLRELALPSRRQAGDPLLRRLIALQQALGGYQDCLIGGEILAQHGKAVGIEIFRQALDQQQDAWLGRIRARLKWLGKLRLR